MASEAPAEERLFNLILALVASRNGLTKTEILETVGGYRDRYAVARGKALENLDRQFERDKEALRDLGIRVETADDPSEPGNNQRTRYRIPREAYELPEGVSFTPGELALLGLAATVWQEGSLSAESRRALTKLRGLGVPAAEPVVGFRPLVRATEPALDPLRSAIEARVIVEFDYLKAGDAAPTRRRVSPLALVLHEGRWLLVAAEPDGFRLNYLVRRIVGKVAVTRTAALAPEPDEEVAAIARLDAFRVGNAARIRVVAGSDAETRLRHRGDTRVLEPQLLEVHWTDLALFADELVALQPEAFVLDPPELVGAVVSRLAGIEAAHG